jgi:hypothetical protein
VPSLRDRIVKLDRMLAVLARISPSSRGRLTPTILTLHSLLMGLLRQRQTAVSASATHVARGRPVLGCGCLAARPAAARPAALVDSGAAPVAGGAESQPPPADGTVSSGDAGTRPVYGSRHWRHSRQAPAAATPLPVHNPTGAPGVPAGGALATGGATGGAAAPVTALALSLVCAFLSRVQRVGRTACRPTLFELRPERPG